MHSDLSKDRRLVADKLYVKVGEENMNRKAVEGVARLLSKRAIEYVLNALEENQLSELSRILWDFEKLYDAELKTIESGESVGVLDVRGLRIKTDLSGRIIEVVHLIETQVQGESSAGLRWPDGEKVKLEES